MFLCIQKMPGLSSFRQVDEKHIAFEVDLMLWSPKMDLIAVTGVGGEVIIFCTVV